ncbi:MAG TPA: sigma 54-interacting transcriptional regulator [Candidatus Sumerlaeota bacterium]|nr:sigma 54-interacting transcriptional regulator [Candidatus Sumerlaeota bacterium]
MSSILIIRGPRAGARLDLGTRCTLGRAPSCDVELPDSEASRVHAEIAAHRKGFIIRDLDSKNGIYVNGRKVASHALLRNDEVTIGSTVFIFDPDYDLQDARYEGSPVYVSEPLDETMEIRGQSGDTTPPPLDDKSVLFVRRLVELLTPDNRDLPSLLTSLLSHVVEMFSAECGFLMLWDPVLQELQPVVSISPGDRRINVSRRIVTTTFQQQKALLSTEFESEVREAPPEPVVRSAISAPLLYKKGATGLIYLDRPGEGHYDLRALALLQAVARLIAHAVEQSRFLERALLKTEFHEESAIIGRTPIMATLKSDIERFADQDATVLITGETGTGKELVARALHDNGPRRDYPFVAVNCTAVPETLFESELFGYEKGAFTGAARLHRGRIEMAHGGTLFLDEIGDMKPALQPKLLRFLQEKLFYRVGGNRPVRADVRIIAATSRDLRALVGKGDFREDLFYRLNVMTFQVPPLRERTGDIRIIAEHYIRIFARRMNKPILGLADDALIALEKHPWPGNVRELCNAMERAVIFCEDRIIGKQNLFLQTPPAPSLESDPGRAAIRPLADVEKDHILRVLKECRGNQARAAALLGIHRNTLRNKMQDYGLQ